MLVRSHVRMSFPLSGCSVPVCRVLPAGTADFVGLLSTSTITLADERTKPEGSKSPSADEQIVLRKHERAARKSGGGLDGSKAVYISRSSRAMHCFPHMLSRRTGCIAATCRHRRHRYEARKQAAESWPVDVQQRRMKEEHQEWYAP